MKPLSIDENAESRMVDSEQHWNELHQAPLGVQLGEVLRGAGRRLRTMPLAEVAGFAVAGVALGVLFFSRGGHRRTRGERFTRMIEKSVIPAARKGLHHAYDTLRDGKTVDRVTREMSKLRSRW
ncbi:hypothetical protein [Luteolibacter luteus]|uniref:Uncharacterized protein n=1 Tax=Luteolibacter luteus TaxID=2728835 RepID=A0A858RM68_9BACT|nr:hypothetical protein [Luteolibacter luteus]QJE97083.1 hypothetical protein HHL09_15235 [Luteolibacter luteus]